MLLVLLGLVAVAVAAGVLLGRAGEQRSAGGAPPSATPAATDTAVPGAAPVTCSYRLSGQPARPVTPPAPTPQLPQRAVTAVLRTTAGDIPIELAAQDAPCAVQSFLALAATDFYDDTPCHRLVDRGVFVLHCGDPTGTGQGGPGYQYDEENLAGAAYRRGTVAVVNSGPGTSGSQFFLVYDDSPLPAQYTPLGQVTDEGLAVLDAVAQAGARPADEHGNTRPARAVQILDVVPAPPG